MQARAAEDLKKLVTDRLVAAGLIYEGAKAFATPRRLALTVQGVPARQPDVKEERKGPRVGAPEQAIAGFLQGRGARLDRPGQGAARQEGRLLRRGDREAGPAGHRGDRRDRAGGGEGVSRGRSRCAGARRRRKPGALTWVRPLHSIVATFGPETEEPEIVPFDVDGIAAGDTTAATASWRPAPIKVQRFDDYVAKLETAKVVLDPARRARDHPDRRQEPRVRAGLRTGRGRGAARRGRRPGRMAGGADGLVRRGVPDDPRRGDPRHHPQQPEMLRAARPEDRPSSPTSSSWSPTSRRPTAARPIVAGNERVIRARLSDAKFFYETDLKTRLEDRLPKFEQHRVPREARHAGRAHRAHRALARPSRAARRRRRRARPSARRGSARPIC